MVKKYTESKKGKKEQEPASDSRLALVFEVNGLEWRVLLRSQAEFKKYIESDNNEAIYFGVTAKQYDQIWLGDEAPTDQRLYRTIKHELVHVFVESYGFNQYSTFTEENMADFIECYGEEIMTLAQEIMNNITKMREEKGE